MPGQALTQPHPVHCPRERKPTEKQREIEATSLYIYHRVNFVEYPKYQMRQLCRFFNPRIPSPMRDKAKKDYLHPSLVFATIIVIKKKRTQNIPRNPEGKKQKSPSVVRLVSRDPWARTRKNQQQTRHHSAKCSSTNMRRFPSLVSNGNLVTSHLFVKQ